jgi:hypothetical protein
MGQLGARHVEFRDFSDVILARAQKTALSMSSTQRIGAANQC